MRVFFLILLLANLFVLAFNYFTASEPHTAAAPQELNADKLRILGPGEVAAMPAPPAAPQPQQTPESAAEATSGGPSACLAWGVLPQDAVQRARDRLGLLNLGDKLTERSLETGMKYWVYLPPAERPSEADKRIAELRKLKIADVAVVQDEGAWHNAISFGVFKSEDAAARHQKELAAKGIKGVKVGKRGEPQRHTVFIIRDPTDDVTAKVTELATQFSGTELQLIVCSPEQDQAANQ